MEHQLPKLEFALNQLEPYISQETVDFHYNKHHKNYITQLNTLIKNTEFEHFTLDEIVQSSSGSIFNNAAQVWNHNFYWKCLSPNSTKEPSGILHEMIQAKWGNILSFKDVFSKTAISTFGSGWGWLVLIDNKLDIISTSNAQKPQNPLLTCDVWEHAYYIDYRNSRLNYMNAFWNIVNWEFVSNNLNNLTK